MNCPCCHAKRTGVLKTKTTETGSIMRRRFCSVCRHRWTTYEFTEIALADMKAAVDTLERVKAAVSDGR